MPPDVESLNLSYDDVIGTYEWRDVVDEYNDLLAEVKRLREGIKSLAENIHDDMRGKYLIDALMELIE